MRHLLVAGFVLALSTPLAAQQADYAAAMRRAHAHDAPTASPAVTRAARAPQGEMVQYGVQGGRALRGYLARSATAKGGPAVILIHEWWGLNDNIKAMADQFAAAGYTALAVDLFGGKVATKPDSALQLYQAAMKDVAGGEANLVSALGFLKGFGASKIGSVGWCFGGHWSLRTALAGGANVSGTVIYYGAPITDAKELGRLQAPVLGLFAAKDGGIPVAAVEQMAATAKGLGKRFDVTIYPGVDHAFANPSGGNYNKAAADDAMAKTLAFFAATLK